MTATIERPDLADEGFATSLAAGDPDRVDAGGPPAPPPPAPGDQTALDDTPIDVSLRPLIVAACSTVATALTVGGIFGSWGARLLCVLAGLAGVGWAWLAAQSSRRTIYQAALPVVAILLGVLSLTAGAPGGPGQMPHLVRAAIKSSSLLRVPIPFDAGWRPILIVLLMLLGFAAGAVASLLNRPRLGLILPLPLLGLTLISQPKSGQALAGILAVLPVIAGLTVLFGAEGGGGVAQLGRDFELRRVIKAAAYMVGILVAIVLLNSTSLLFPKPSYNPAQRAQKPKPIPLSAADDRVLFEVAGPITGPWKLGSLDEYDGAAWRLPPFDPSKLQTVPSDGVIDKTRPSEVTVSFTIRDLGGSGSLPGVAGPTKVETGSQKVLFDPRAGTVRVSSGRVPAGLAYKESRPTYPTPEQLRAAQAAPSSIDKVYTKIPPPPPAVRELLNVAPSDPWDRLDFVLKKLTEVEVAVGAGTPTDVPPAKVQKLLAGNHEGSPYELVAAQALLARWAGVPSRIGFGFDGEQQEGAALTVRPKNAAQWLEVYFDGHGWIPIITQPPKAKASLDNDKNTKFNPTIQAGSDVAVQVYIPVKVRSLKALYQTVRSVLFSFGPLLLLLFAVYLATPFAQKAWRRAKRRRWAASVGPGAQIAVEYCELRDLATDLGIGDPYATPIEYLDFVVDDAEHEELAWLVTKALYGEMRGTCTTDDVTAARELADSLRQRLLKAQPFQTRALAVVTKLSLEQPYSEEVPVVHTFRIRIPRSFPRRLPWSRTPVPRST